MEVTNHLLTGMILQVPNHLAWFYPGELGSCQRLERIFDATDDLFTDGARRDLVVLRMRVSPCDPWVAVGKTWWCFFLLLVYPPWNTLPETHIATENPPFWWYLPGKMGIFMGYVSFREGMMTPWKIDSSPWKIHVRLWKTKKANLAFKRKRNHLNQTWEISGANLPLVSGTVHCGRLTSLAIKNGPFEDVFPDLNTWTFHCYVSLPEGMFLIFSEMILDQALTFFPFCHVLWTISWNQICALIFFGRDYVPYCLSGVQLLVQKFCTTVENLVNNGLNMVKLPISGGEGRILPINSMYGIFIYIWMNLWFSCR